MIDRATQEDLRRLTDFCVGNKELERLNTLLSVFNVFEAAGLTRDEVKHSRFLAFLLDPREAHGLGDAFATRLLQKALAASGRPDTQVSMLDLELWDLGGAQVLTEWSNIDILVLDHAHRLAVIIENKVGTDEHSNQLEEYLKRVRHSYKDWKVLPMFLTIDGHAPAKDHDYIGFSYQLVIDVIDELLASRSAAIGESVRLALEHYEALLRRYVVSDSQIPDLCRQIYRKHQRALDLIFQYRMDLLGEVRALVRELVKGEAALKLIECKDPYIVFLPKEWIPSVPRVEGGWWQEDGFGYMLMFWFDISESRIRLNFTRAFGEQDLAKKSWMQPSQTGRHLIRSRAIPLSKTAMCSFERPSSDKSR